MQLLEEALALFRAQDHRTGVGDTLRELGWWSMAAQQWELARAQLEQSAAVFREVGSRIRGWLLLLLMTHVIQAQGDYRRVLHLLDDLQGLSHSRGFWPTYPWYGIDLPFERGRTLQLQGDAGSATRVLEEYISPCRNAGDGSGSERAGRTLALSFLGPLVLGRADGAGAVRHYCESLTTARDIGNPFSVAVALAGLAEVARQENQLARAARLSGTAVALGDPQLLVMGLGSAYTPTDWLEYERTMAAVRAQLDDPVIAAAWAEGQQMTLD